MSVRLSVTLFTTLTVTFTVTLFALYFDYADDLSFLDQSVSKMNELLEIL